MSYDGDTTVYDGTMRLTSHPLPATTKVVIGTTAGTLDLNNLDQTVAELRGGTGEIRLGTGTLSINQPLASRTYSGAITGGGGLVKQGLGILRLEGNLAYTGLTTVEAGTLVINAPSVAGDLRATGGILRFDGPINLGSKNVIARAGGAVEYDAAAVTGGVLHGPGTQTILPGGTTTMTGTAIRPSAVLAQNGTTNLTNVGNQGQWVNNAPLTWSGGSNEEFGMLTVNDTANLDHFENRGEIIVNSGGLIRNSSTNFDHFNNARVTVNAGGVVVNLGGTSLNLNDSRLINNGAVAGTTNINSGSLAKGLGMFGPVNVTAGGRFSPGNSPGNAQTEDVVWDDGGRYLFEIADAAGAAGVAWDLWDIDGTLIVASGTTDGSRFIIDVVSFLADGVTPGPAADFNPFSPYSWPILGASDGIIGFSPDKVAVDASRFVSTAPLGQFSLAVAGDSLRLNYLPSSLPGDMDQDGDVDRRDTALFVPNLGTASGANSATGDFNGDRMTTLDDLHLMQFHMGQSVGPSPAAGAVPEPASLALAAFAVSMSFIVRRGRTMRGVGSCCSLLPRRRRSPASHS
jgi:autotransporter-associated beta strand protein